MPAALLTNRSLSEPPSVLIVGAGIAGLALGRALRARGISAEIIERITAWTPAGTGIYLPANGVRALQSLGLGDAVTSRSVRMTYQRILDNRGRLLAEIDLDAVWGAIGPCVGMRRADLHSLLLDGAHGVPLRLGTTVTALTESHDAVTVVFDDGVQREYDVVVGADGVHSTIRRLAFGRTPPHYVGQVSWRFLSEYTHGITNWTVMLARGRAFLTVPVPGGLYCYADLTCERIERAESDIAPLRSLFLGLRYAGGRDPRSARERRRRPLRANRRSDRGAQCDSADRAHWRRRARDLAQHGPGRVHGPRGCPRPQRDARLGRTRRRSTARVFGEAAGANPVGAATHASAGSRPVASCVPEKHRSALVGSAHVSQRLSTVVLGTVDPRVALRATPRRYRCGE